VTEPIKLHTFRDFEKYNFFRKVDWRWERVLNLVHRQGPPARCTRRDDKAVRAARSFVVRWANGDATVRDRLFIENPGLYYAYDFHRRLESQPTAAFFIQARLLARQTPEQIGEIMGVLPDTVQWYADLYFDVVPYLDQRDWITNQVLVPAMIRSTGSDDPADVSASAYQPLEVVLPFMDGSLKMFAYFGGPFLVDYLLSCFQAGRPLGSHDDYEEWMDRSMARTIRRRANQAAMLFQVNKYNVMQLFELHAKIMEIERSEDSANHGRTGIERHVSAMLDEIPWAAGTDAAKLYQGTPLGQYDDGHAELRDAETIDVAAGRAIDIKDKFPERLPEPRAKKAIANRQEEER
jgi:hypothetical protein